ncbi:hypothetical protein LP037_021 [Listeria phage LP-037]|uniref:Uncharacterized protein n=2 Tax=Homburgvirus LP37 TaxID=1921127 RepID=A0A6C0QZV1_9CAUD|nr:hypothetical protein LP037_021 [Listeria phage LP-037]AGI11636.1 hypothetical protein LP037_021 [Listeria phage LP-037]QHZ59379.1 hypothetical protein FK483_0036 [Listeria phage LP-018]
MLLTLAMAVSLTTAPVKPVQEPVQEKSALTAVENLPKHLNELKKQNEASDNIDKLFASVPTKQEKSLEQAKQIYEKHQKELKAKAEAARKLALKKQREAEEAQQALEAKQAEEKAQQEQQEQASPNQEKSQEPAKQETSQSSTGKGIIPEGTQNGLSAKEYIAYVESRGDYNCRSATGKYIGRYQLEEWNLKGDYSPANQERAADAYVAQRYGTWEKAKEFHIIHGWY